jgi:hypothetical protein
MININEIELSFVPGRESGKAGMRAFQTSGGVPSEATPYLWMIGREG